MGDPPPPLNNIGYVLDFFMANELIRLTIKIRGFRNLKTIGHEIGQLL